MPLKLVTAPVQPIPLVDIKQHLRIDGTDEDALIAGYASAAMYYAQEFTKRAIATQTWELVLDEFPSDYIEVPLPPLASVSSIKYIDTVGTLQTWAPANYTVDLVSGRIFPAYGQYFPATRSVPNAVTVQFVAGYTALPDGIRSAMLLVTGDLYAHREAQAETQLYENRAVDALLWPYKVF